MKTKTMTIALIVPTSSGRARQEAEATAAQVPQETADDEHDRRGGRDDVGQPSVKFQVPKHDMDDKEKRQEPNSDFCSDERPGLSGDVRLSSTSIVSVMIWSFGERIAAGSEAWHMPCFSGKGVALGCRG